MDERIGDDRLNKHFWKNVEYDGETECWIWIGGLRTGTSIPVHTDARMGGRTPLTPSRITRAAFIGDITVRTTDGIHLRRKCGNPLCVSPDHGRLVGSGKDLYDIGWCRKGIHRIKSADDISSSGSANECKRCRNAREAARKANLERRSVQEADD